MATYNKFQDYAEQLNKGVHDWSSHTFNVALTNSAPNAATADELADITQISAGNGYTTGGQALDSVTLSESGGTAKVVIADEVFTASGSMAAFRYPVYYNDSSTGDKLVCYYDYGSSVSLLTGETFTLDHDATNGLWQLA